MRRRRRRADMVRKHTHTHTLLFLLPQPGCVNTTEMDIRKCRREKNPHRVKKVSREKLIFTKQTKTKTIAVVGPRLTQTTMFKSIDSSSILILMPTVTFSNDLTRHHLTD